MSNHAEIEILLVEDNPHDAELTVRTLRKRHHTNRIAHVKDGQAALDWLFGTDGTGGSGAGRRLKVVLLDLKLPKVDGLEVLRAIRAEPRTALLPVVIMSSSNEDRDVTESYTLGANSYVVKPMDFDDFAAAVADLGQYWLRCNREPAKN